MIQFDVKNIPTEIKEPDLVIAANAVIEALYKLKVDTVPLPDPVTGARFPSLARIYIQTHLLRLLMFLEGGVHEHEQQRPLFAIAAARSMYESIASFHDFSTQLCQKLDKGEFEEAAELLLGRAFATRLPEHIDPDESNKVVNVVTQVHRLSKSVAGFEDTYNRMSEFVHPNAYGSVIHFHSLEGDHAVFYENGKPSTQGLTYLILASFLSALFVANVTEIENRIKTITA
jgi:hypothetical protein